MALDTQAIVSFGYLPTITTQIYHRVVSFGWMYNTVVPPVVMAFIKAFHKITLRQNSFMRV